MLKILHTSDWHLGKKLYKHTRLPEQELFLKWLVETIRKEDIDLLIVAGDIFDIPNPATSALQLFYDFVFQLSKFPQLNTIIITGNHDSSSLLNVPAQFFKQYNCHVVTQLDLSQTKNEVVLKIKEQNVGLKLLPYFRNHELFNQLGDQDIESFFQRFFSDWKSTEELDLKLLVAHHGFGQYSASGSEHAIFLSGLEYFPLKWLEGCFDYVALGHIHKKQKMKDHIVYPGSPIPLRFSEDNQKSVSYISFHDKNLHQKFIDIPQFRKLVRVQGNQTNYLKQLAEELSNLEDSELPSYLEIEINLEKPASGLADNIREFIKSKPIELVSFRPIITNQVDSHIDHNKISQLNTVELFKKFYQSKFPEHEQIPDQILEDFTDLLNEVKDAD